MWTIMILALTLGDTPGESVRSAYLAGRDREAVLLADRALADPSSADRALSEIHFWRGAALRRLGRNDEAAVALDAAGRHGLRTPELHVERALALRATGQDEEARRAYQEAERLLQDDPERLFRFQDRWRLEGKEAPKFQLWVTPQMGYDSNVVALDKDAPLVQGDVDRESPFAGGVILANYFLLQEEERHLSLDYRLEARAYTDEPDLDYTDNLLSATGRIPIAWGVAFELRGSLGESFSSEEGHLRTLRIAAPSLLFNVAGLPVRLWSDWTDADYYDTTSRDEYDRDGLYRRAGAVVGVPLGAGWSLSPGVYLTDFAAEGDDYDYASWTAHLSITSAPMLGIVISPRVDYTWADYENPNSLVNFTEEREDRILAVAVTLTFRSLEGLFRYAPSVTVAFTDHSSNIGQYDYERWEPRIEVGILTLAF